MAEYAEKETVGDKEPDMALWIDGHAHHASLTDRNSRRLLQL